ncbi:MAG TPA: hypothetical protein VJP02_01140 [Candidatus Sulfotelmatobacter sp.]|nr:hypothetical protein [Candidatus Sulfotelmatobacter sp.]
MSGKAQVGDVVWYLVGDYTERQQAEIVSIEGTTQARVRILTGPQKGTEIDAPWGVIQRLD